MLNVLLYLFKRFLGKMLKKAGEIFFDHALGLQGYTDIPDFYSENPAGSDRITYRIFPENPVLSGFWVVFSQNLT